LGPSADPVAETSLEGAAGASGASDPSDDAVEDTHRVPGARDPDDYTDPPGAHRRGPDGPALDVGG
jgi:hypothetical protein